MEQVFDDTEMESSGSFDENLSEPSDSETDPEFLIEESTRSKKRGAPIGSDTWMEHHITHIMYLMSCRGHLVMMTILQVHVNQVSGMKEFVIAVLPCSKCMLLRSQA